MKFAVFTYYGLGLPIAKRLQDEGAEVVVARVTDHRAIHSRTQGQTAAPTREQKRRRLSQYEGILAQKPARDVVEKLLRVKSPEEWFLFFDLNHLFRFADQLRGRGFHGNFPTEEDFCYELDRERAKEFVASNYPDIRVAEKHTFHRATQAAKFLRGSEELWVLKGLGEDARTVVPDVDDIDLAHGQILEALKQNSAEYESAGFILELMVRNAMELTPQKVFNNGKPIYATLCIENKPIGSGNLGPMTDCAQDLVFRTDVGDKINRMAFPPAVDEMAKAHEGLFFWDASLLLDPRTGKAHFGEFCANRPGYNSLYTELALAGSAVRYFKSLAAGRDPHTQNQLAASVRLFNLHRDEKGMPLAGCLVEHKRQVEPNLWFWDVRRSRGRLETCGYVDTIGVATGRGHTLEDAVSRAYGAVDGFSFEGGYHRPKFDFLSDEYKTSIVRRFNFGSERGLYPDWADHGDTEVAPRNP